MVFNPKIFHTAVQIPKFLLSNPDLTLYDKLVWACLANYYNETKGYAFPTIETVSNDLAISERQVIKSISKLESYGILTVERPEGQAKLKHVNNRYRFKYSSIFDVERRRPNKQDKIDDVIGFFRKDKSK